MRVVRPSVLVLLLCLFLTTFLGAQNAPTSTNQGLTALQNALMALARGATVNDVTLTGMVEWIAGSDDEKGTAMYRALPSANRLDLSLSGGTRSEIRNNAASGPAGAWIGTDGVSHSMALHNLQTDPGWFPLFALSNIISSSSSVVTYLGLEIRDGASLIHLSASQQFSSSPSGADAALLQHLTQTDIYLDPTTLLPASFVFNIHPDNNALLDIPTEIRYSNYQNIGGAQIPLHVEKFLNNNLTLDLHFQNASLNTGITAAQIGAQ